MTTCGSCNAGYIINPDSQCLPCPEGSYSDADSSSCSACGSGKWSEAASSTCSICTSNCGSCATIDTCGSCNGGYHLDEDDECSLCAAGTFAVAGSTLCAPRNPKQYSGPGSSSCSSNFSSCESSLTHFSFYRLYNRM